MSSKESGSWLFFFFNLPGTRASEHVKVWRRLKKFGAIQLKVSTYVLPDEPIHYERFQWLAKEIVDVGGEATLAGLSLTPVERAASNERQPEQRHAIESVPSARPRTDVQLRQALMRGITEALEGGNYDELETQFTQFHRPGEELEDGSRKIWIYFAAFQDRTASAPSLDDAQTFVQKAEEWTTAMPASVAARLALCNALLGETATIAELARKGVFVAYDRKVTQELTALLEECKGQAINPPERLLSALEAEPEFYDVALQLLGWTTADFEPIEAAFKEACAVDPFYVPIYLRVTILLNGKSLRQGGAPKPGAWLTETLKTDRADPEPARQKKIATYAQTFGLLPADVQLDPQDLDWPTLKVGLFQLVRAHKSSLDWPSRCLEAAYAFQDVAAAKEALELIQGNYSPEVFPDPATFRDISRWVEEASEGKCNHKKPNP